MLNHLDAKNLFAKYCILLEGAECTILSEAEEKVAGGGTFFLKLVSSSEEATHKTEYGYVRRVHNPKELRDAWTSMEAVAKSYDHKDIRFILQEGRDGHEVMIGAKRDPIFGFQIIFTPEGGKYAEICAKAVPPCVRVGKITPAEARQMITEHVMSPKIMGVRGEAPSDIDSLANIVSNISNLMAENPKVEAIDLNPVFVHPGGVNVVDARVEVSQTPQMLPEVETNRSLLVFIRPKRAFAVIASAKPNSVGAKLLGNLLKSVGDVRVMLTTGKGKEHLEELGVPIVDDVPDGCDLLVYAGLPGEAPNIVRKFREKGGEGAVIISSDFAETGNKDLEKELHDAAGRMPYIGPNCLGVYSASHNTFFIDEKRTTYPATNGKFAFFTQSGSLGAESFCEYMSVHGVPVAAVFSLGNGSGITFTEILNRVADEPTVNAIVMHLEGGLKEGEGQHFVEALKKAMSIKPVIILPAGLSAKGRESAASHTGRMTGGADALRAALKQGGAIVATNEEELRLAVWMLHVLPRATGKTIVLTGGGGKGVLATDAAERIGLELREKLPVEFSEKLKSFLPPFADPTKNPFDFTGSVTLDGIVSTIEQTKMLDSPGIFYYGYHVPGATVTFKDGKPVGLDALKAIEEIALTIKNHKLPLVLHIIGQTGLARAVERKAEEFGIVVTRASCPDLVLGALKLTMEVWKCYPNAELMAEWTQLPDTSLDCLRQDSLASTSV
jgi:acyl-CoA synthetase (NDP forming)